MPTIKDVISLIQQAKNEANGLNVSGYKGEYYQRHLVETLLPAAEKAAESWWVHSKEQ